MKENRAGEKTVRYSFLCKLPFQQFRSGSDRRQHEVKLHNRIVYTNYAVPTGALDSKTSRDILALLEKINEKYGTTMLIVTHNHSIRNMVHKVIRIKDGQISKEYYNETRVPAMELEDL